MPFLYEIPCKVDSSYKERSPVYSGGKRRIRLRQQYTSRHSASASSSDSHDFTSLLVSCAIYIIKNTFHVTMSNLKTYLAEKYMSGPKADAILSRTAPLKKKKRKAREAAANPPGGTMIRDEDVGWEEIAQEDDNDDLKEAVVANDREFKKRKVANTPTPPPPPPTDEQPMVVDAPPVTGGLVNAQQLKKMLPQYNATDTNDLTAEEIARAQETVYRDSSGKKIDTKAARAEAARLKRLREEKEAQKMEWGKGLVQKDEAEKRRQELEKQRSTKFARHADDKDLNEDLKAKELWNDPAAAFLTVRFLNKFLLKMSA